MVNSPLIRPAISWEGNRGIGGVKSGPLGSHDGVFTTSKNGGL